jgi:hypothetical protein
MGMVGYLALIVHLDWSAVGRRYRSAAAGIVAVE